MIKKFHAGLVLQPVRIFCCLPCSLKILLFCEIISLTNETDSNCSACKFSIHPRKAKWFSQHVKVSEVLMLSLSCVFYHYSLSYFCITYCNSLIAISGLILIKTGGYASLCFGWLVWVSVLIAKVGNVWFLPPLAFVVLLAGLSNMLIML